MPNQNRFIKQFKLLGLPVTASAEEVNERYRRLALWYHPDKVSKNEAEEANEYMIQLTEARNKLLDEYYPIIKSLKRSRPSDQAEQQPCGTGASTADAGANEESPPTKKQRLDTSASLTRESYTSNDHATSKASTNTTTTTTAITLPPIDVAQIRLTFAEVKNERILSYLQHELNLPASQMSLHMKSTKVENIIFATEQRMHQLLVEQRQSRQPQPQPLSAQDLDEQVNHLCQSTLTHKWATNSKSACLRELTDVHGYDTHKTSRWTHWQMVNELVRISGPSASASFSYISSSPSSISHKTNTETRTDPPQETIPVTNDIRNPQSKVQLQLTTSQQERNEQITSFSSETNLTLEYAEKCLDAKGYDLDEARTYFREEEQKGHVWEGCYIGGVVPRRLRARLLEWQDAGEEEEDWEQEEFAVETFAG